MPGSVQYLQTAVAKPDIHAVFQKAVRRRGIFRRNSEHGAGIFSPTQKRHITFMDHQAGPCCLDNSPVATDVIKMPMGIDDHFNRQSQPVDNGQNPVGVCSRINNYPFQLFLTSEDITVNSQLSNYNGFEYHGGPLKSGI